MINGPPGLDNFLIGSDLVNTWHITGNDQGTLQNSRYVFPMIFTFINFPNISGKSESDTFTFDGSFEVTGTVGIDGGGGTNIINGPPSNTVWNVLSQTTGNINPGAVGETKYINVNQLNGNIGNDSYNLSGNITLPQINAGTGVNSLTFLSGWTSPATVNLNTVVGFQIINGPPGLNNTLTGNNLANIWRITGDNAGTLENSTYANPTLFSFTNFGNIFGGVDSDVFVFSDGVTFSGQVDGGAPPAGNVLNYDAFTTPVTITLITPTSGTASNLANGFINIESFTGNYTCTNCSESTQSTQGYRVDAMLSLTKESQRFEWRYGSLIYYNYYGTLLNSVLYPDRLINWEEDNRMPSFFEKSGLL